MKRVYVQLKNGLPINVDVQNAIDGFEYLGYDDDLRILHKYIGDILNVL